MQRRPVLALAMAISLLGITAPPVAEAGAACSPLLVSSPSSPVPGDVATVRVGEDVTLQATLPPNADVVVTFVHNTVLVEERQATVGPDGLFLETIVFEPTDLLAWSIDIEVAEACGSIVSLTVVPAGPHVPVTMAARICPAEIQTVDDLAEAGGTESCDALLRAEDEVAPPAGFSAADVIYGELSFVLTSSDGFVRNNNPTRDAPVCDPATLTCDYRSPYAYHFVAAGPAQLTFTAPDGYRVGIMWVESTGELRQTVDSTFDPTTNTVTFDVPEQDGALITVAFFANVAPAPTPPPAPVLPDTAVPAKSTD